MIDWNFGILKDLFRIGKKASRFCAGTRITFTLKILNPLLLKEFDSVFSSNDITVIFQTCLVRSELKSQSNNHNIIDLVNITFPGFYGIIKYLALFTHRLGLKGHYQGFEI